MKDCFAYLFDNNDGHHSPLWPTVKRGIPDALFVFEKGGQYK